MSVLTYEREPSSLTSTSPYPSLPTNKLSEVKELLDSLVANKSHRATSQVLTPVVNSKTDLNDGSSPDNSPSREAAKMIIKSPKKGILVKRRINDSSIISGMKLTNESYAPTHMSACSFGEISPVKGGSFGPQSEYFLNGPSDQPDQLDGSPILAEDEKEKKVKRVTFETTTCFNKPSPNQNQRRPFMVRSSKTLANWFAKERNQRSLDLNQRVAKLTIFKKGDNLQLSSGSSTTATTTINYQNPKFFAPQNKVTTAPKLENSSSYASDPRKVEIKKKLESNAYYLKSAVKIQSPEKDRDVESASPSIRRGTTKNLTDVPKGQSAERIISSQYGRRKEMLSSPSYSFRNPQGSNSMMINISGSAHSTSPKKPDSYQRTIFKDI